MSRKKTWITKCDISKNWRFLPYISMKFMAYHPFSKWQSWIYPWLDIHFISFLFNRSVISIQSIGIQFAFSWCVLLIILYLSNDKIITMAVLTHQSLHPTNKKQKHTHTSILHTNSILHSSNLIANILIRRKRKVKFTKMNHCALKTWLCLSNRRMLAIQWPWIHWPWTTNANTQTHNLSLA